MTFSDTKAKESLGLYNKSTKTTLSSTGWIRTDFSGARVLFTWKPHIPKLTLVHISKNNVKSHMNIEKFYGVAS